MSNFNFPWNKPAEESKQSVSEFIDKHRHELLLNQIELLEFFRDKIYGFDLRSFNMISRSKFSHTNHRFEAIFYFIHLDTEGEIKIVF